MPGDDSGGGGDGGVVVVVVVVVVGTGEGTGGFLKPNRPLPWQGGGPDINRNVSIGSEAYHGKSQAS
jgi:hypothetical protein